jgi:putative ABC transport system ATP-binding protein
MLKLDGICKTYRTTEVETRALVDVSIEISNGEFVAIMGPSGCGKSTLLNVLGLLDSPDSGRLWFDGKDIAKYGERQLTALRRVGIGFVFQRFNLIDDLTVAENIEVSLLYRGIPWANRRKSVALALEQVRMSHRSKHLPHQLSGGQQQRVAIARAVVMKPSLILADEPTGNLDTENGAAVMELLLEINKAGTTIIMVTHSRTQAGVAKRPVNMLDGRITSELLAAV